MQNADDVETRGASRRAAAYLRMSTDHQQYSIENQAQAISDYAQPRGIDIVRTYADAARSGLTLQGRKGLRELLSDVREGRADFTLVLVYDVSRWGRFQDSDESAYYEFICKESGVIVEYCAETFKNDGSLTATIIKNIKRAMAGEFSRELSVKVFAAQSRIAANGFHVGATPGYALRRVLLDERGQRKMELAFGQRKSIQTERVIIVPGPIDELETVQYVYDLFIDQRLSLNAVSRTLNSKGIANVNGRDWTSISVRELLANEKYIGNCVYNRTSKKLGAKWRRNPSEKWVRAIGAFEPVVSPDRFREAQRQLRENASFYTDNELLDFLRVVWRREGILSKKLIESSKNPPSINTYRKHFGSLANAYRRIGFIRTFTTHRGPNLDLRKAICKEITKNICQLGGTVQALPGSCQLRVNGELTVTVVVGRSPSSSGYNNWRFGYRTKRKPDILVVARIGTCGSRVQDYFVLPYIFLPQGSWFTLSGVNYRRLESFRSISLEPFYNLCARTPLDASDK
jgi:DNA invertase Pin-like site-specific DNA recombinase